MVTIRKIDAVSAMKVGALLYALNFTVFGLLWLLFQNLLFSSLASISTSSFSGSSSSFNTSGLMFANFACCMGFYVGGVIAAAIGGAITGAVTAFFYNLVANWVGGLRVVLDTSSMEPEKAKREVSIDPTSGF
ncbi:MAG: DUF3566 domain-containing protein [Anaerolineae bacterium]|nr:DUF3566 domain-containing protein [Anaerolineae bacterium]